MQSRSTSSGEVCPKSLAFACAATMSTSTHSEPSSTRPQSLVSSTPHTLVLGLYPCSFRINPDSSTDIGASAHSLPSSSSLTLAPTLALLPAPHPPRSLPLALTL